MYFTNVKSGCLFGKLDTMKCPFYQVTVYNLKKRLMSVPGRIRNRPECTSVGGPGHCLQWLILFLWLLCLVIWFCI